MVRKAKHCSFSPELQSRDLNRAPVTLSSPSVKVTVTRPPQDSISSRRQRVMQRSRRGGQGGGLSQNGGQVHFDVIRSHTQTNSSQVIMISSSLTASNGLSNCFSPLAIYLHRLRLSPGPLRNGHGRPRGGTLRPRSSTGGLLHLCGVNRIPRFPRILWEDQPASESGAEHSGGLERGKLLSEEGGVCRENNPVFGKRCTPTNVLRKVDPFLAVKCMNYLSVL